MHAGSTQEEVSSIVQANIQEGKISGSDRAVAWDGQTQSGPGLQNQIRAIAEHRVSSIMFDHGRSCVVGERSVCLCMMRPAAADCWMRQLDSIWYSFIPCGCLRPAMLTQVHMSMHMHAFP